MTSDPLITVGILFLFAILGSIISTKFKQPYVLGLLIAGAIIGPNAAGIVNEPAIIEVVLEFGTILFLFSIGLEFSLKQLMKLGVKGILLTMYKMGLMFFTGFILIMLLGMDVNTAVFIGFLFSFTSTMISVSILKQKGLIKRNEVPLLLAILILEDIIGLILLNFLAVYSKAGSSGLLPVLEKIVLALTAMVVIYLVASKFAERFVRWLSKNTGEEVLIFISLGLCVGFAALAYAIGLSPAVGAFLAGSIVANFRDLKSFQQVTKPHSFMFTSLFFIAIGTMIDITSIHKEILLALVLTIGMIIGIIIFVFTIGRLIANYTREGAVFSGMAMLPMGVFSLLIAREGMNYGIARDLVTPTSIAIFILTLLMSLLIGKTDIISRHFKERFSKKKTVLEVLSHYIFSFFQELEVENEFTRKLKKRFRLLLLKAGLAVFIIFALTYVLRMFIQQQDTIIYISAGALGILYYLFSIKKLVSTVHSLTANVLARMDGHNNIRRTRKIANRIASGFTFLLFGLLHPFIMFIFNLNALYTTISIILILAGILSFHSAYRRIKSFDDRFTPDKYRKISPQMLMQLKM